MNRGRYVLKKLIIHIIFSAFVAKKISKFRTNTALRTDERVRLMNEIVRGIKVIKMYTWEKPFAKLVALARKHEIKEIRGASFLRGILMSFAMFSTRFSTFISILIFVVMGNDPNAYYVFVITSFYNSLRQVMTNQLPQGMALLAELNVSIRRIQNFLENEDVKGNEDSTMENAEEQKGVFIKNVTAKWDYSISDNTLSNINVEFSKGQLVAIVGSVGSGKSSLLQVILKELPLVNGSVKTCGSIAYAAQEAWLFTGSIRQNILFGQPFDNERYNKVIKVCALERDFSLFPFGDRSIVGERGVLLSGGQKARIGLARAVYKEADIYLLDDPLSAVDTNVGKQLFENCINGFLKKKCVILVTHQLQYLANVDNIIVLENGQLIEKGSYKDLRKAGYLGKLVHEENEEEKDSVQMEDKAKDSENILKDLIVEEGEKEKHPKELKEHRSLGKISSKVYLTYIKAGGGFCVAFLAFLGFLLAQTAANGADYFITFW